MSGHKDYKAKQYLHNGKLVNISGLSEVPEGATPLTKDEVKAFIEQNDVAHKPKIERELGIQALARKKLEEEYDALSDKEKEKLLK